MGNAIDLLAPVWTHMTQVQPARAEGIYLYDAAGARYTDFTSGIGVTNTGHCHPRIVKAIQDQAANLIFGQMNIVIPPTALALAERLNEVTPAAIDQFFFSNSGAEAVEASVKLARMATQRKNVIVMQGSFHGRTHQAMAMTTSKYIYRYNYQPLPGAIFVAPFPYSYYYGWNDEETTAFCLRQLDQLLHSQSAPDETAAIIIEPVLGEGGYVPAPAGYLQALRALCDEHGILLIADEVQTGFGRTGKFFAMDHAGVVPDILVMAKGLGSGMPISAIGARAELMAHWKAGTHGGTYGGGNAVAAAAACATIDTIRDEKLVENAAMQGERLMAGLREIQAEHPVIGDVRGLGLMVGVEFTGPDGAPDAASASRVQKACLQRNLLLLTCGTYGNVIRWIPPLVVSAEQIDAALEIFNEAVAAG
ncbi:MAG: aminotransferase class III-fold pyridoxal phosphate-dependent enzyme [Caldilinea sp.]|nr:aminotransferase class III-fold pyridoxal phosphate-dependent enzyme [Caldilinea sp.]MCB0149359.1 aminotransferase class III-fold pyridoxal phosphate-dependent enzyme [Caldilineaceae bacterium]MCB0041449.1 aminotransferase class III-fold pyridoxal phosphate-dependent enzyme [Caldilinea sp.]MCB0051025.1 aminotransferase class III-fold pyridoxal phosphate-dependent enzyme [Caldilinea sp.]MCB9117510.1 aminotransferase class III-fold pyridoxal phosphate-dependent enzyme [Caldilineaceae bacterium